MDLSQDSKSLQWDTFMLYYILVRKYLNTLNELYENLHIFKKMFYTQVLVYV